MGRKKIGLILTILSAAGLVIAIAADSIFNKFPGFGLYQIIATFAAAVALGVGVVLLLKGQALSRRTHDGN